MKKLWWILASVVLAACAMGGGQPPQYLKIGTGAQSGVYYLLGTALSDLVNETGFLHNLDMTVEATEGSVANINGLMKGELDFALAQADRQYEVANGKGPWEGEKPNNLRFICSLHMEAVTLLAAEDTAISEVQDLRGKVVSIGASGSGTHENALDVMRLYDLQRNIDYQAEELKPSESSLRLQDNQVDAYFYTVGHPNSAISDATNGRRKVRLVPITGVRQLLDRSPYYAVTEIPIEYYPKATNSQDVKTVGMRTVLLTRAEVDDEAVYQVTKLLFDHLDWLRRRHPSLARLRFRDMLEGGEVPLHNGARRYLDEVGAVP